MVEVIFRLYWSFWEEEQVYKDIVKCSNRSYSLINYIEKFLW